jgi:hypothetical protein
MPVDEELELISAQLDLLLLNQLIAKTDRDNILAELKKEPSKIKEYAEAFAAALPAITSGVIALRKLGKDGDPYAISMASLEIFSGIVAMAGPLLGPVGPIVSALASMVSMILGEFLPKPPNLLDEIEALLDKFVAEDKLRGLGTAADQIWVLSDTIEHHSTDYRPLNLQHGTEIKAIDDAWQWLNQLEKQSVPLWDQVLEKTCQVWLQLMRCVVLSVVKPSTKEGAKKGEMLVYLPARQELFLKYLRSIKPVAQNRGLYIMTEAWETFGYCLDIALGRSGRLSWGYEKKTDWLWNFSILIPREQIGSPAPQYHVFTLSEGSPRAIARLKVDSLAGKLVSGTHIMEEDRVYQNTGGGERRFESCVCAWSLTSWEDPDKVKIYTAHSTDYNYVNIHEVDSDNNVNRLNWEPHTAEGLLHIRAVVRDLSQSLPDDGDAVGLASRLYEVIYGGYRESSNIWVALDNSWLDVPTPWSGYNGIEVDKYCLWVFGKNGIACATHASVVQALRARRNGVDARPKWMTYHTGWRDGFNVKSVSPCADGILAVSSDQSVHGGLVLWTGTYKIDLKGAGSLDWNFNGSPRGGRPGQIGKMPIHCWTLFDGVLRDLEKKVGKGHDE